MKRKVLSTFIFLFGFIATASAQDLNISETAETFWDDVSEAAPFIIAAIFLISALANMGKLFGENRDYMGFFRGLLLWAAVIGIISAIVTFILSLSF
ncbi:hypothetical protein MTsPCn9_34200 [Croceitalea sp. MTPC9]|uniref:hypothetical protein n=1 Tax=unclassified Croceitalea TaxID=2632280 RepID=UPI002B39FC7A|nr:hypothetical protein MTsPCn6_34750 [Croceitalea sp. MTPC6]GMN18480.1 hypothetical protein MTsPCn9_34200 [Croceitalea sp. MTPC9]